MDLCSANRFTFVLQAANRAFHYTELYNVSAANGWLFPGIDPEFYNGPALNLSIPAAYDYFKQHLAYYPSVGVKGYKIDRGEEEEMPGKSPNISSNSRRFANLQNSLRAEYPDSTPRAAMLRDYGGEVGRGQLLQLCSKHSRPVEVEERGMERRRPCQLLWFGMVRDQWHQIRPDRVQ